MTSRQAIVYYVIVLLVAGIISSIMYWRVSEEDAMTEQTIAQYESEIDALNKDISTRDNMISSLHDENNDLIQENKDLRRANEELTEENKALQETIESVECLGSYTITYYCNEPYPHICGEGIGLTATGAKAVVGETIAVDPSIIPYGTEVYIEGIGWRVAQDCGGAVNGRHIDILVDTHEEALSLGSTKANVWVRTI